MVGAGPPTSVNQSEYTFGREDHERNLDDDGSQWRNEVGWSGGRGGGLCGGGANTTTVRQIRSCLRRSSTYDEFADDTGRVAE